MGNNGPLTLLAVSGACLLLAPLALRDSYSFIEHGVSESAAQNEAFNWIARTGFLLLGVSVIWLARRRATSWQQPGTAFLAGFGLSMIGVAVFSARSWDESTPWNTTEDSLHSVFASAVGVCFIGGLASVIVARAATSEATGWLAALRSSLTLHDVVPLAIACVVPLLMSSGAWGLLQRTMFAGAYVWFARAAIEGQ